MSIVRILLLAALVGATVTALANLGAEETAVSPAQQQVLQVYAAASLTESFQEIERSFEAAHPGVDVRLRFDGSQALQAAIERGDQVDVFASASSDPLLELTARGHLGGLTSLFASNELAVAVRRGDADAIARFEDLPTVGRLALGAREVPVGGYARMMLRDTDAGFEASTLAALAFEGRSTRQVLARVERGDADAAIVYRTDVLASDRVSLVEIPKEHNVKNHYSASVMASSRDLDLAEAFVRHLSSPAAQAALERRGLSASDL